MVIISVPTHVPTKSICQGPSGKQMVHQPWMKKLFTEGWAESRGHEMKALGLAMWDALTILQPEGRRDKARWSELRVRIAEGCPRGIVAMVIAWAKRDKDFFCKEHKHPDEHEMSKFQRNLYGKKLWNKSKSVKASLWVVWILRFVFEMSFHWFSRKMLI